MNLISIKNKISSVFIVAFALLSSSQLSAQCSSEAFMDKCASVLEEFNFIKSYEFENKKSNKGEYSYVFSKGSAYRIVICDEGISGNRLIVTLYDRNHKKIVSSYDKRTKKHYPTLTYPCSATGVYYIAYEFEGSKARCAVNILGFSKGK